MTCDHVLGLIDAGPFADYPTTHLDAAWAHARQCATCGLALRLATALTHDLSAMPNPEPPAPLAPAIMARIARLQTTPTPRAAPIPADGQRTWRDYASAGAGAIAAALIAVLIASGEGPAFELTSPRVDGTGLLSMEATGTWWVTLAVSLVLYLVGLFAPVGARGHLPPRLKP